VKQHTIIFVALSLQLLEAPAVLDGGKLHTLTTLLLEKQSLIPTEQEAGGGPKARLDAVAIDPARN
jgi:hypothetical protein